MSFTSRSLTWYSWWISEKNPLASSRKRGKEPFWNVPGHSVLLRKTCPQEKQFYQDLIDRVLSKPNWPGWREMPNLRPLGCSIPLKRVKNWGAWVKFTVQGCGLPPKKCKMRPIEPSPPLTPYDHISKCLFRAFLLPNILCSTFNNNKIMRHFKRQRHSLERWNKHRK